MPPKKAISSRGKQKASEEKLLLNCLVRGEDSTLVVSYDECTRVVKLKELIYEKRTKTIFRDIQPDDLTLYKAELHLESLAETPLSELTLVDIPQKHALRDALQLVLDLWPNQPAAGLIHIFVDPQERKGLVDSGSSQHLERVDSVLVQDYQDMFIKVEKLGVWTRADILNNRIHEKDEVPLFVQEYEQMLDAKRRVPSTLLPMAHEIFNGIFNEYCNGSDLDSNPSPSGSLICNDSELGNEMTKTELIHLGQVSGVQPEKCWLRKDHLRHFKEPDAAWLWFYTLSFPYKADEDFERGITVKVNESWPFEIVIEDNQQERRSYRPRNNFTAFGSSLPRLLVEVNSKPENQPPQDHFLMVIQAATIVRFANRFLERYKTNQSCVVIAAFIGYDGDVERYVLFQDMQKDARLQRVYYKKKLFKLNKEVDRVRFTLELYNLLSVLDEEGYNEDTMSKIGLYRQSLSNYRDSFDLPPLTGRPAKNPQTDKRDNRDFDNSGTGSGGDAAEQLEFHGYVLMPDYFEDKGGRMEPLIKLPPHIYTVYRQTDTTQTELVAKHVDEQSTELEILDYLHTMQPQSAHIITLDDTVPTNTGKWAIFPKMHSVHGYLAMGSDEQLLRCGRLSQLGWDLIDGLAFLHKHGVAHLDIKLGNLVYSDDFRLKIIDFDSAVRVESENDMVEGGDYGTPGWMAPEIQDGSTFSPIRADRWSCGKVLLCFVEKGRVVNTDLEKFAEQLMDDNPLRRPSLVDWSARLDETPCDDDDQGDPEMDECEHKELKAQVKNDLRTIGGLESPAKRRRVLMSDRM